MRCGCASYQRCRGVHAVVNTPELAHGALDHIVDAGLIGDVYHYRQGTEVGVGGELLTFLESGICRKVQVRQEDCFDAGFGESEADIFPNA